MAFGLVFVDDKPSYFNPDEMVVPQVSLIDFEEIKEFKKIYREPVIIPDSVISNLNKREKKYQRNTFEHIF